MWGRSATSSVPTRSGNSTPWWMWEGVRLGAYTPKDGHTDPASATNSMAAGARQGGAEIYRHTLVTDTRRLPGGEWDVVTDKGSIRCEHVVNATGSFAPQVARWVGLEVPIVNMVHPVPRDREPRRGPRPQPRTAGGARPARVLLLPTGAGRPPHRALRDGERAGLGPGRHRLELRHRAAAARHRPSRHVPSNGRRNVSPPSSTPASSAS